MPPFRNPFSTRKPASANGLEPGDDENVRPVSNGTAVADGQATKPSVALNIKGNRDEPNEFKLSGKFPSSQPPYQRTNADLSSAVNDSGVYLPVSSAFCDQI